MYVRVENIGDGDAYDAQLSVVKGEFVPTGAVARQPAVTTGESLVAAVRVPMTGTFNAHNEPISIEITDAAVLRDVVVRLTWNHPPHRWLRRHRTRRVSRIAD